MYSILSKGDRIYIHENSERFSYLGNILIENITSFKYCNISFNEESFKIERVPEIDGELKIANKTKDRKVKYLFFLENSNRREQYKKDKLIEKIKNFVFEMVDYETLVKVEEILNNNVYKLK